MNITLIRASPKECPFCHDMPILAKDSLWNGSHGYYGNYEYYVVCKNGKCKINPRTKSYNDIYDMSEQECIEKAIEDWNERLEEKWMDKRIQKILKQWKKGKWCNKSYTI